MIKQFGAVAKPVEVTWHNPAVAQAALQFGAHAGASDAADASLKTLAHMAVAAQVGCSWRDWPPETRLTLTGQRCHQVAIGLSPW